MEKKNVFFSCVMDDVYKEFSLKNIDSFKSILESELEEAKKEVDFKKIVLINRLLKNSNICLETVESLNDDLYSYISTLLSKIELEEVFTMPMNRISAYFKAMTNLVLNNPSLKEELMENEQYFSNALTNTSLLNKNGSKITFEDSCGYRLQLNRKEEVKEVEDTSIYTFSKITRKIS